MGPPLVLVVLNQVSMVNTWGSTWALVATAHPAVPSKRVAVLPSTAPLWRAVNPDPELVPG